MVVTNKKSQTIQHNKDTKKLEHISKLSTYEKHFECNG